MAAVLTAWIWLGFACGGGSDAPSDPSTPSAPATRNLGIAVRELEGEGDHWLVLVSENDEARRDLNGDGDALDFVYHALDLGTGELSNLALAASRRPVSPGDLVPPPAIRFDGSLAAFFVDEALQGGTDLNGDGDAEDTLLHFHDFATGQISSVELGALSFGERGLDLEHGTTAFLVSEEASGRTDLDGDGFPSAHVLHLRSATGTLFNTRLAALPTLAVDHGHVALMSPELTVDLNGDGDRSDFSVFRVYDVGTDTLVSSDLVTDLALLRALDGRWLVQAVEFDSSRRDLNGDGDLDDLVFHSFDPTSGIAENLGVSSRRGTFAAFDEHRALLPIEESSMGIDLNGDGDASDVVVHFYDARTNEVKNTRLATRGFAFDQFLFDCTIGIAVSESQQGLDLNADGDLDDAVFHTYDATTDSATNQGFDALEFRAAQEYLLFLQSEVILDADLNGDGDTEDPILSLWNSCTQELHTTEWSSTGTIDAHGMHALLVTPEDSANRDLNGDGDIQDSVLSFLDLETREVHELGFAFLDARIASDEEALVLVNEAEEGADLNGDGDLEDFVLHVVAFDDVP